MGRRRNESRIRVAVMAALDLFRQGGPEAVYPSAVARATGYTRQWVAYNLGNAAEIKAMVAAEGLFTIDQQVRSCRSPREVAVALAGYLPELRLALAEKRPLQPHLVEAAMLAVMGRAFRPTAVTWIALTLMAAEEGLSRAYTIKMLLGMQWELSLVD